MEFTGSMNRWSGHGNREFRDNVCRAYLEGATICLIVVRTDEIARVEAGEDASRIKKDFSVREDLVGRIVELDESRYVFRFVRR